MILKHFWKNKYAPGFLFIALFILEYFSILFEIKAFHLIANASVGFVLLFFYFMKFKMKFNKYFVFAYLLLIISDYIYFFNFSRIISHHYVLLISIVFSLFLISFAIRDFLAIKLKSIDWYMLVGFLFIILFFLYICRYITEIVSENYYSNDFVFFKTYGFILYFLLILVILNFIVLPNNVHINLTFTSICLILSEIFFAINEFYLKISIFVTLNILLHFLVYFLLFIYEFNRRLEFEQ